LQIAKHQIAGEKHCVRLRGLLLDPKGTFYYAAMSGIEIAQLLTCRVINDRLTSQLPRCRLGMYLLK